MRGKDFNANFRSAKKTSQGTTDEETINIACILSSLTLLFSGARNHIGDFFPFFFFLEAIRTFLVRKLTAANLCALV